ncbi:DUF294 nucleotidyltransferase-like domain-containing protein [Bacillus weihaiensis]|uniref:DUF294 nucleotidyltransferase-like domain-containing protein n=1 Tax=Bacillus weihaiensis TaxID=1547283 RepID=UPI00235277CA|nr:DUF294 nucleotidyltransferase-like domain-containing protein [Bacillus weihaiensis]
MQPQFDSYETIREFRVDNINRYKLHPHTLNEFHDQLMRSASELALLHVQKEYGEPPCRYTWFVMGSGGRNEQGLISDQDHGLVYEEHSERAARFFSKLGAELSKGLHEIGYPYCEGKIMSSNSMWCKSLRDWDAQLYSWMDDKSWESIRYLQIFYDGRALIGDPSFIIQLKKLIIDYQSREKHLLHRFLDNIQHIKPSVGPLGQIYVELQGPYEGCIDWKKAAFLPYVNAIRLLSIKEGLYQTGTLERMNELIAKNEGYQELKHYRDNFILLLEYRTSLYTKADSYDDVHYLNIKELSREQKRQVKYLLKDGKKIHQLVQGIINKGCIS